jgi:hypothetical protein
MSRPKPWPKAANEVRSEVIMEAGAIRAKIKSARKDIVELQMAIQRRDLILALAITASIDNIVQILDKSAELIALKLENARAANGEE